MEKQVEFEYRICWKHVYQQSMGMIVGAVTVLLAPAYFTFRRGPVDGFLYHWISLLVFLAFFLPFFILHLRYFFLDRGRTLIVSYNWQNYELKSKDSTLVKFTIDDIKLVEYFQSYVFSHNKGSSLPWEMQNYSRIYLKDGRSVLITSLLIPKLEIPVAPENIKLRTRFYCYPSSRKEVF